MHSTESSGAVVSILASPSEDLGFKYREANGSFCQIFPAFFHKTRHLSRSALRYVTTASIFLFRVISVFQFVQSIYHLSLNLQRLNLISITHKNSVPTS
jgi:hypothetical protein